MLRKHLGTCAALLTLLLVTSCQGMFDGNVFDAVDKPTLDPTKLSTATLEDIRTLAASDKFFEELQQNDEAIKSLVGNLFGVMTTGSTEEKVAASELFLEVMMWGTDAGDGVNTLLTTLLSADPALLTDNANPEELQNLLQQAFGTDPEEVYKSLSALQAMNAAYVILSMNNGLNGLDGDMVTAAPFAVLADMLYNAAEAVDSTNPWGSVVDFIVGDPVNLSDTFDTTALGQSITDINGSFDAASGELPAYPYLDDIIAGVFAP